MKPPRDFHEKGEPPPHLDIRAAAVVALSSASVGFILGLLTAWVI